MSTAAHISRALSARGLTPAAKLVLLIAAIGADMDGRYDRPLSLLAEHANLSADALVEAITELARADLVRVEQPIGAPMAVCLLGVEADGC